MFLYLDKDTPLHRLNPATKIIGLVLLFILPLCFTHPLHLLPCLGFVLLLTYIAKSFRNLRRMWFLILLLAVLSTVLWSFFRKGESTLFRLGFLSVSWESVLYGTGMGIRLNTMLISGLIFLSCTKVEEFTLGLRKMGLPFSVSFALSLAFRLVPLFFSTASTVVQAQRSRGLDLEGGNIFRRMRKYVPLLIPIFVYAIRNTDLLAMALESKGFGANRERTYYLQFKMRWIDYTALISLGLVDIGCLWLPRLLGFD